MAPGVAADLAVQRDRPGDDVRVLFDAVADDKEGGARVVLLQHVEDQVGMLGARPVVKRQCDQLLFRIDRKRSDQRVDIRAFGAVLLKIDALRKES